MDFNKFKDVTLSFSSNYKIQVKYEFEVGGKMTFTPDGTGAFSEGPVNQRLIYKRNKNFYSNISSIDNWMSLKYHYMFHGNMS